MSGIGRGQVLVVDDDPAIRRSLERGLRLAGFAVALAGGGRPALAHVRREPTDVVVLDISMPDLDGIQVCRALREDGNDLPVLMLLALDETADRIAGLQAGGRRLPDQAVLAAGVGAAAGCSAAPSAAQVLCKRVPKIEKRLERALNRLGADATRRGSIARLAKRVENAKTAGDTEIETYLNDMLTFRRSLVPTLEKRRKDLTAVKTWCKADNNGSKN